MVIQKSINIDTTCRGTTEITSMVNALIKDSSLTQGLCNLFIAHTSASLIICENVDPTVRTDLESFMQGIVPDGNPIFQHTTIVSFSFLLFLQAYVFSFKRRYELRYNVF